jgi:urea transport system permease protein
MTHEIVHRPYPRGRNRNSSRTRAVAIEGRCGEGRRVQALLAAFCAFLVFLFLMFANAAHADEASVRAIISKFADAKGFSQVEKVIDELAATGDPLAVRTLNALNDGKLQVKRGGTVYIEENGRFLDPITGEPVDGADTSGLDKVKIKNSLRRTISAALSGMTLMAKDPAIRSQAASTIFDSSDPSQLEALEKALAAEEDPSIREQMEEAKASIQLFNSRDPAEVSAALDTIKSRGDRAALALLSKYAASADGEMKEKADVAIRSVEETLSMWEAGQNVWYGISLGSVLFLAAIGLAITFGVMGVINMAHGEMVMLGAYTTFVVQELIRTSAPGLFEYSLLIALPMAFLVAGGVGLLMERSIIRFLYGRPLETLLATWGVSLILQQAVRTIFGPTNREVGNPDWMSGAFTLGEMSLTWNRVWIVCFSLAMFVALQFVLKKTYFGLQMRAVTQNRRMASSMAIRTPWVDAMTFALGSGIAGLAGVALSQIDNVSPNLGQSYIIDSFMVVVFGGVGNLWGTLIGAFTLGIANKFLEPYAGAVLGKILVLVFIILFIQRRPRGLFAQKGRAVEA